MIGAIVKVRWKKEKKGWAAELLVADEGGFEVIDLAPDSGLNFEISDSRRCTGYWSDINQLDPCPEFKKIESGCQCKGCRKRDIYSGFRRGNKGVDTDRDFSVYLAQCGSEVKVGVTRSERMLKRWIEQGADYAAEIAEGLSSEQALEREEEISDRGITQRIRKERKIKEEESRLREKLDELDIEAEIVEPFSETVYPPIESNRLTRSGRIEGEVRSVKGQIVSTGRQCKALSSGKVIKEPEQQALNSF